MNTIIAATFRTTCIRTHSDSYVASKSMCDSLPCTTRYETDNHSNSGSIRILTRKRQTLRFFKAGRLYPTRYVRRDAACILHCIVTSLATRPRRHTSIYTFCELVGGRGEQNNTWTIMLGCNESNIIFQQHLCKLGQLRRSKGRSSQVSTRSSNEDETNWPLQEVHTSRGETLHLLPAEGRGAVSLIRQLREREHCGCKI